MKRNIEFILIVTGLLAIMLASHVHAVSFRRVPSFSEIVQEASLAFRGQVVEISYNTVRYCCGEMPYTKIKIQVYKGYRGAVANDLITIMHEGGKVDGTEDHWVQVAGLPAYEVGDHVVILANDKVHPFWGTLYADLSVRRIIKESDGKGYVLTEKWSPLISGPDGSIKVSPDLRCEISGNNRNACGNWYYIQDDSASTDGFRKTSIEDLLTVEQFDAFVQGLIGSSKAITVAPQALCHDVSVFEKAYIEHLNRISAPLPLKIK